MTTYFNATSTSGKKIRLASNDTFTLAFCPGMVESTPITLRAFVSEKSLRRLEKVAEYKINKALELRLQISEHGAGLKSAQIFDGRNKLVGDLTL